MHCRQMIIPEYLKIPMLAVPASSILCSPRKPCFSEKIRSKHCVTKHTTRLTSDVKKKNVVIQIIFLALNNQCSQLRNLLMVYALIAQLSSFSRRVLSEVQIAYIYKGTSLDYTISKMVAYTLMHKIPYESR